MFKFRLKRCRAFYKYGKINFLYLKNLNIKKFKNNFNINKNKLFFYQFLRINFLLKLNQLKKYIKLAFKLKINIFSLLQKRLDVNCLIKFKFNSLKLSRQKINHGFIKKNKICCIYPSYFVKINDLIEYIN